MAEPRPAARAARAPRGTRSASNPIPIVVPCHRVLHSGGGLGGYGGGLDKKVLLRARGRDRLTATTRQSVTVWGFTAPAA